uniref:Stress-response A/B barrel domain-containing protein n=1 Tax=Talaromyces marneffei PM1 TaxID=1077442 RepID=A0A093UTZ1_TALMA
MPVYHIGQSQISAPSIYSKTNMRGEKVLFHLKPEVTDTQIAEWSAMAKSQLGQVPGLLSIEANKPLPVSVSLTKGYDMALVAVLEGPEFVEGYSKYAASQAQAFRERLFDDTIAFDLQF